MYIDEIEVSPFSYSDSEKTVLEQAANIIAEKSVRHGAFTSPEATKQFLSYKLAHYEREVFGVMLLDNQHRLIEFKELFFGTIDSAAIYPRELVKLVLRTNAAAVILAHNHPSGVPEPSASDRNITEKLKAALALVDVRVLDHIIIGEFAISFAERGIL